MIATMFTMPFYGFPALVTLIPAVLLVFRSGGGRDFSFWGSLILALFGAGSQATAYYLHGWGDRFAFTLWVTITVTLALFSASALVLPQGWRLHFLLAPYLFLLGGVATVFQFVLKIETLSVPLVASIGEGAWFSIHVIVGILAYVFLTFAAIATLSAFLQERALKRRTPNSLTRKLPSVSDSEGLSALMLLQSGVVLGFGLCSGMAVSWFVHGSLISIDHKSILSVLTFLVVITLIFVRYISGLRGQAAARLVLLAWLLLTLAWPGVKFVSEAFL